MVRIATQVTDFFERKEESLDKGFAKWLDTQSPEVRGAFLAGETEKVAEAICRAMSREGARVESPVRVEAWLSYMREELERARGKAGAH